MGMENVRFDIAGHQALPGSADMFDHGREVGFQVVQAFSDLVEAVFEGVQTGHERGLAVRDVRRSTAAQHGVEVLRVPAKGGRQGLKGAATSATLDGVVLKLAHDRLRDLRAFRKLALSPPEFIHALVDGLGNRRPIFRHVFGGFNRS